jgi:hypothetical protein
MIILIASVAVFAWILYSVWLKDGGAWDKQKAIVAFTAFMAAVTQMVTGWFNFVDYVPGISSITSFFH